jgi:hypothetical protein
MILLHTPDFVSFSEAPLLQSFTSATHRPNLLITCDDAGPEAVIGQLQELCASPFHRMALPGRLSLPAFGCRTLVLHDVSALTLTQQVALYDWISHDRSGLQIVSVTQAPLRSFVAKGLFLECLFYRLNTVCVVATSERARHQDHTAATESLPIREFRG